MAEEMRQKPRFSFLRPEDYEVSFEHHKGAARLINFSRSGLSFVSRESLEPNEIDILNIKPSSGNRTIPCKAHVVWRYAQNDNQEYIYGANIILMDPADKADLITALYEDWKKAAILKAPLI